MPSPESPTGAAAITGTTSASAYEYGYRKVADPENNQADAHQSGLNEVVRAAQLAELKARHKNLKRDLKKDHRYLDEMELGEQYALRRITAKLTDRIDALEDSDG